MIKIITLSSFEKELKKLKKKYRSIANDYSLLLDNLEANPYMGIDLGKGVRKVRMAISAKGKGKSHGARIITYTDALVSLSEGTLTLLFIYDKAERQTITDKEIDELLKEMNQE